MIGSFFSFGLILSAISQLVYTGWISIPILRPSSSSCLHIELADLWSLDGNNILRDVSFMLHARVEIGLPETFLVTKLLMVDCSSWAGYWSRENVCLRRTHSRWNSCQVDDSFSVDHPKLLITAWIIIWKFIQLINFVIFNISSVFGNWVRLNLYKQTPSGNELFI